MYGILWLTLWATVGEAFYDDYWFDQGDAGIEGLAWGSKKHLKHNFSESLRSFHKLYNAARERPDEVMTMAKAKLHLKELKVYRHSGKAKDYEPARGQYLPLRDGAKYCTMGRNTKVDCNQCACVAGQMYMCTGMICPTAYGRPTFLATCREGRHRKIDACNFCFCRNGHEICTNKDCNKLLQFSLRNRCPEGYRSQNSCNRCLCIRGEEYCTNYPCNRFSATVHKDLKESQCVEDQIWVDNCNICYCREGKEYCENNDCGFLKSQKFVIKRNGEECIEGSRYKKDECNYCFCFRGREHCTEKHCGDTSLSLQRSRVCKQGDSKNESCNFCYCFLGNWICTRLHCPAGKKLKKYETKDHNNDINFENECERGQTKKMNCNSCECHHEEWICTIFPCSPEGTKQLSASGSKNLKGRAERCIDGSIEMIHCNECHCRGSTWYCTLTLCADDESDLMSYLRNEYHLPVGCKNDEEKYIDCNLCLCYDQHWVCTQRKCDEKYDHDVSVIHPKELADPLFYLQPCTSGEERRKDMCNLCYCNNKKWYCQIHYCGKSVDITFPKRKVEARIGGSQSFYTAKCRKGSKRKKDSCNTCYCRHKVWFCENKACADVEDEPDIVALNNQILTKKCQIGHVVQSKCHYCVCMAVGYKCRMKKQCQIDPKTSRPWLRNSKCKIGTKYTVDECNHCYCSDIGEYICTNNTCLYSDIRATSACEIGKTEQIDSCNYCYCSSDQIWDCTSNYCPGEQAHSYLRGRKCLLGSRYRLDACNYCYCNYDRELICSNHSCPQYHVARTSHNCEEGRRQIIDACNHCVCNFDGHWDCTSNYCPEPIARTVFLGNPESLSSSESWFLKFNEPCVNGARQEIDACNYCTCLKGREFCTQKNCKDKPTGKYFMEPPCISGEPMSQPDPCNECICLDSAIVCSKIPCIRTMQVAGDTRSRMCVEADKYYLEDGCNYCVCNGGQEFCTSRACMLIRDANAKCNHGDIIPSKDNCNMCVCVHGKVTCTNKTCPKIRRQGINKRKPGFRFKKPNDPTSPASIMPGEPCVEGFFYNPVDYDPKCPNICFCDRGELLCTNRPCRWREKALPPEWGTKSVKYRHTKLALKQMGCVDYQSLPSDEPCSHCHCLNNRRVCNITNCVLNKEETFAKSMHMKEKKPLEPFPDLFCTPFTFYSPDNNRFCRNCFCLHNGLSLCLLNFCKYSKDIPHKPPESIHDMCTPGETGFPTKCVSCKCSEHGKWVCTRERLSDCNERNCDVRDEFQMGFQTFCAACKCASKEWYCAIEEGPCSGDVTCPMGTFIHNPKQFCSLCLCGGSNEGSNNMCFTETKCVQQVIAHLN